MIVLYYACMGVSTVGIRRLINHKCRVDRHPSLIDQRIVWWKDVPGLYDYEWNLQAVGAELAKDKYQPRQTLEAYTFEHVVLFRQTERDIVGDYEVGFSGDSFACPDWIMMLISFLSSYVAVDSKIFRVSMTLCILTFTIGRAVRCRARKEPSTLLARNEGHVPGMSENSPPSTVWVPNADPFNRHGFFPNQTSRRLCRTKMRGLEERYEHAV